MATVVNIMDFAPALDESSKAVADDIEETIHTVVFAVNHRLLGPDAACSHPVWFRLAPDFIADPEYPARDVTQTLPVSLGDDGSKTFVVGRSRLQAMFRLIVDAYPDYQMMAKEISTTVHERARWAISYVTLDSFGSPPGVVRPSLGVFEWKQIDGRWLMTKYEGMAGIAPE